MRANNQQHQSTLSLPVASLLCLAVALVAFSAGTWFDPRCELVGQIARLQRQNEEQQQQLTSEASQGHKQGYTVAVGGESASGDAPRKLGQQRPVEPAAATGAPCSPLPDLFPDDPQPQYAQAQGDKDAAAVQQLSDAVTDEEPQPTQFVPAFPENAHKQQSGTTPSSSSTAAQLQLLRQEVNFLRQRAQELRKAYGITHCALHGIGPRGGFCVDPELQKKGGDDGAAASGTLCDTQLCSQLAQLFANLSVADFGAGRGQYGKCLGTAVGQYTAYDGGEGVEAATDGAVRFLDLSEPTWLGRTFDWVMSLEVGEHIPKEQESAYVGNIVRHASRGVVLSWAVPGQGGHHHVNNQVGMSRRVSAEGRLHVQVDGAGAYLSQHECWSGGWAAGQCIRRGWGPGSRVGVVGLAKRYFRKAGPQRPLGYVDSQAVERSILVGTFMGLGDAVRVEAVGLWNLDTQQAHLKLAAPLHPDVTSCRRFHSHITTNALTRCR